VRLANPTALAALVLAVATACSNTPGPPGDILLITVDTLRPDHLGIYGYGRPTSPNLERWMVRVQPEGRAVDRRRYYDLASDPEESRPRDWDDEDRVGERLIELCLEDPDPGGHPEFHDHGSRITDPKVSPRADERAVEKLRSLGYVD